MMRLFVARVELRGRPGVLVYARLHAAMQGIGFRRSFTAADGRTYDLPHGTYAAYTRSTLSARNAKVLSTVKRIWKDHVVLTMEVEDMEGLLMFSQED